MGKYVNLKSEYYVNGYTEHYTSGFSKIHISPHISGQGDFLFQATAGHELIHAYHHFTIPGMVRTFSEKIAYKYSFDILSAGGYLSLARFYVGEGLASGYWGVAPLRYQLPPFMKSVLY